jgi:hypothetical protein
MIRSHGEKAVSEIVGEMMMITIVLILVAIFAANAGNLLPPPRDPSVTIIAEREGGSTADLMNITLYHKGGDWIQKKDITVIVAWGENTTRFREDNESFQMQPEKAVFDLGSRITISDLPTNQARVSLVTPRKVIFFGEV